jgi:hypothetical protein
MKELRPGFASRLRRKKGKTGPQVELVQEEKWAKAKAKVGHGKRREMEEK